MDTPDLPRLSDLAAARTRDLQSLDFAKFLAVYGVAHGDSEQACEWYVENWPRSFGASAVKTELKQLKLSSKAPSPPATTGDSVWGAPLVGVENLASGFLQIARSASLLGRVPGLRRIPFQVRIPVEDQGPNFSWVTEQGSKPVSESAFSTGVTLTRLKAAGIVVFTTELIRAVTDATAGALRDTLTQALVSFTDKSFLDPASAAIAGSRPASITNGLTPVTSTGDIAVDVAALLDLFFTTRPSAQTVSLISGPRKAAQIQALNSGGGVGHPVIITSAAANNVIAVDGSGIFYSDDGVEISVSNAAAIQMDSAPISPPDATVVIRSLWQDNLIGYRLERFLNFWAQPGAVQYLA